MHRRNSREFDLERKESPCHVMYKSWELDKVSLVSMFASAVASNLHVKSATS